MTNAQETKETARKALRAFLVAFGVQPGLAALLASWRLEDTILVHNPDASDERDREAWTVCQYDSERPFDLRVSRELPYSALTMIDARSYRLAE